MPLVSSFPCWESISHHDHIAPSPSGHTDTAHTPLQILRCPSTSPQTGGRRTSRSDRSPLQAPVLPNGLCFGQAGVWICPPAEALRAANSPGLELKAHGWSCPSALHGPFHFPSPSALTNPLIPEISEFPSLCLIPGRAAIPARPSSHSPEDNCQGLVPYKPLPMAEEHKTAYPPPQGPAGQSSGGPRAAGFTKGLPRNKSSPTARNSPFTRLLA